MLLQAAKASVSESRIDDMRKLLFFHVLVDFRAAVLYYLQNKACILYSAVVPCYGGNYRLEYSENAKQTAP